MRSRYLVIGLVVAFVVVTGMLIYQARHSETVVSGDINGITPITSAAGGAPAATGDVASTGDTATPAPPNNGGRPQSNVPMKRLAPGERAPQFIIFSFDGGGSHERWNDFMAAAAPTNSRFTGFLSGIYLLGDPAKDATVYTGPGHAPGKASIGYGGPEAEIVTEVNDVNLAYSRGHEIGTQYGHFCDDNPPGGNQWSTADWNTELDEFFTVMANWKTFNGYTDAPDLTVPLDSIKGGRTPCLTGSLAAMNPAWKAHS